MRYHITFPMDDMVYTLWYDKVEDFKRVIKPVPYNPDYDEVFCVHCKKKFNKASALGYKIEDAAYGYFPEKEVICYRCLVVRETDYIRDIASDKLPLFINHIWITKAGEDLYKKCLEGVQV